MSYEDWQRSWREMVDVDLIAAANVTHLVARQMIARGSAGVIVNIGSRGAFRGEPGWMIYRGIEAIGC